MADQPELPLPAPPLPEDVPPLPARMINEFVYCPRLAYLVWVQQEWADTADTVEGRVRHARTEAPPRPMPEAEALDAEALPFTVRSLELGSERLGVVAKCDIVEIEGGRVSPVDIKRGRRPHVEGGAHEPERIQLCVQAMLLEEQGYRVEEGFIWFAESRERVRVVFDEALRARTRAAIDGLRLLVLSGRIPPPLEDSPKCPRCALVGICLPDEVGFLVKGVPSPRPLAVQRPDALPVYVQEPRARIRKEGETLVVEVEDAAPTRIRLADTSALVLFGSVSLTTPALHELLRREIPVAWHTHGGWFLGLAQGTGHRNVELRTAQYGASFDEHRCLELARGFVSAKIRNARTILRRNWRGEQPPERELAELAHWVRRAEHARNRDELLGIEGNAAAIYFGAFRNLIGEEALARGFDFTKRNRRPPADPVNALLSFAYAMLARTFTVTLAMVGFDPWRGFYHRPRYGRPALALDLMESFRPLLADSAVLTAINNGEVQERDFVRAAGACALAPAGRKRFIACFERRLAQEITHPLFGYRVDYRRVLELQARLLGRHLLGELPRYPEFTTR
ncbi:MAG: CRISPR-associated endonuclease Cas1 [Geminicoccaceae bacterium]|nr:CRISPR-associated endonuclease Cas1 [Geminicoccaceae bacterium]MCS7269299.1 CRISPR-associated endonuclease Cas1 [Geminicoccaceae bacterium]MDW8125974.1 CRISPR-associated endonuclease Cas1 [Geminicoccaceae bacterium]